MKLVGLHFYDILLANNTCVCVRVYVFIVQCMHILLDLYLAVPKWN